MDLICTEENTRSLGLKKWRRATTPSPPPTQITQPRHTWPEKWGLSNGSPPKSEGRGGWGGGGGGLGLGCREGLGFITLNPKP